MSVRVIALVLKQSKARMGSRLVMIALADAAHDSGITWITQDAIAEKTLLHRGSVNRILQELEEAGEVQVRKAQRGKRRINVYRVSLIGVNEPIYEDLPFDLDSPFTMSRNVTPKNVHDVTSCEVTVSRSVRSDEIVPYIALNRKVNRKEDLPTVVGARELVGYFMDESKRIGGTVPERVRGQVAKLIGELIGEGIDGAKITAGLDLLVQRRLHPSTLPSLVSEASAPARRVPRRTNGYVTPSEIMEQAIQSAREGR